MVVWKLKSCPRCGGDLFVDREADSWYMQCLQCSHRIETGTPPRPERQPVTPGAGSHRRWPL